MPTDEFTYADSGVDRVASDAATGALIDAAGDIDDTGYAGLLDLGDMYLGLVTDGVGTKLLVAEALADYSTIGIDCIAMNVNDLIAGGIDPLAFVDYLAVESPSQRVAEQIGQGLATGADQAGIRLVGGETAVLPEVITGVDLAGTCVGLSLKNEVFSGVARPGEVLVGWPSTGIHSNGLTLARTLVSREYDYTDAVEWDDRTIGEILLEPTRIYSELLQPMRDHTVTAAAHITGGGFTNFERLGSNEYTITNPLPTHQIFEVMQDLGNVSDQEMYKTFNMGTGFVASVPDDQADSLARETDGQVIGNVEPGDAVIIGDLTL